MNAQHKVNDKALDMASGGQSTVIGRAASIVGYQASEIGEWINRNVWGMSNDKCKQIRKQSDKLVADNAKTVDKGVSDCWDFVMKFVKK